MPSKQSPKGRQGEKEAATFLVQRGYRILEHNWIKYHVELDIVALDKNCLVFVEVKTRFNDEFGTPEDAMTPWKINHLIKAAELYKSEHPELPEQLRIDFVGITYKDGKVATINLIKSITE